MLNLFCDENKELSKEISMFKKIFYCAFLIIPKLLFAHEVAQVAQSIPATSEPIDRASQIIKMRDSTLTHGNYIFTHYKLVKQTGTQLYVIPNTAEVIFETVKRLGRGKATITLSYATAHVQDLEVTSEHRDVISMLNEYLKTHFNVAKVLWYVPETNKLVYNACKELKYEITTKSPTEKELLN